MAGQVWFGTKDYATWVPAPSASNFSSAQVGWSSKVSFLNGRANVRRSFNTHREYGLTWNPTAHHELSPIQDFAHGLHGDGLVYWVDPFAQQTNILPPVLATPVLSVTDGIHIGNPGTPRPSAVPTSATQWGFPSQGALITGASFSNDLAQKFYIPIPPGMDFVMRAYGSEGTPTIRYKTQQTGGTAQTVNWTAANDLNSSANLRRISGGATGSGVEVWINGGGTSPTATVFGAMAQIVPEGSTPLWERFISGQGNAGCKFDGTPATSPYSAALNLVGMTANLVEVGP